jgi:glycosyltransferase involved in cell wall biosynthesis
MSFSVSVIIPALNGAEFLETAVGCAAEQILDPVDQSRGLEIIVVNDGSTDDGATVDTIEFLKTMYTQEEGFSFRVITHETNKGPSAARNTGIKAARGEILAFLDVDDLWTDRTKLMQQIAALRKDPSSMNDTLSFTYFETYIPPAFSDAIADSRPEQITIHPYLLKNIEPAKNDGPKNVRYFSKEDVRHFSKRELELGLVTGNLWFVPGSTMVAHRDVFKTTGPFAENMWCAEDRELVLRHMVRGGDVSVIPNFTMRYTRPARSKAYREQNQSIRYLIETYEPVIKEKWGAEVAEDFVRYYTIATILQACWGNDWRGVASEILRVGNSRPKLAAEIRHVIEQYRLFQ